MFLTTYTTVISQIILRDYMFYFTPFRMCHEINCETFESVIRSHYANKLKFTQKIKSAIFLINSLCVVKLKAEKICSSDVEFHTKAFHIRLIQVHFKIIDPCTWHDCKIEDQQSPVRLPCHFISLHFNNCTSYKGKENKTVLTLLN